MRWGIVIFTGCGVVIFMGCGVVITFISLPTADCMPFCEMVRAVAYRRRHSRGREGFTSAFLQNERKVRKLSRSTAMYSYTSR